MPKTPEDKLKAKKEAIEKKINQTSEKTEKEALKLINKIKEITIKWQRHLEIEKMKAMDKLVLDELKQRIKEDRKALKSGKSALILDVEETYRQNIETNKKNIEYIKSYIKKREKKIKEEAEKTDLLSGYTRGVVDYYKGLEFEFSNRSLLQDVQAKLNPVVEMNTRLKSISKSGIDNKGIGRAQELTDFEDHVTKNEALLKTRRRESGGLALLNFGCKLISFYIQSIQKEKFIQLRE